MAFSETFEIKVVDKYSAALVKMRNLTKKFRGDLYTSGNALTTFGTKASKASTALANLRTGFAAAMLTRGVRTVAKDAFDFAEQMQKVAAWTGAGASEMAMLSKEAKKLNDETKFTALNVAESMGLLAKREFDPATIKTLEPILASLATAGDVSMASVTTTIADALNIYEMGAKDALVFTDKMAAASSKTPLDMLTITQAFGEAGATAHAYGIEFNTLMGILGTLAGQQERGARAGTRLQSSLLKLVTPTLKAEKALGDMGITFDTVFSAPGKMDILAVLEKFDAAGEKAKHLIPDIFGTRQSKVMLKLLGRYKEVLAEIDKVNNAQGEASRISAKMMEGIVGATHQAASAWANMRIAIGESIEFILIPLLKMVKGFADWVKENKKVAQVIGVSMLIGAALLSLVTIFGVVAASVGSLSLLMGTLAGATATASFVGVAGFGALATAMWAATWPVLLIVGAIALIIAGVVALVVYWEEIWGWVKKVSMASFFGGVEETSALPPLSSTVTRPDELGTNRNKMTVESLVKGSIDINDYTGGRVGLKTNGGTIPINVMGAGGYVFSSGF